MRPPLASADSGREPGGSVPDRTLRCRMVASGAERPKAHVRNLPPAHVHHSLGVAELEPEAAPTELLLATLGHCLVDRIRANAVIGSIAIESLEVELEADLPSSPLWGPAGHAPSSVGFETIQVRVHLVASAPHEALQALVSHATLWSPVANTLHAPIHLDVALVSPRAS